MCLFRRRAEERRQAQAFSGRCKQLSMSVFMGGEKVPSRSLSDRQEGRGKTGLLSLYVCVCDVINGLPERDTQAKSVAGLMNEPDSPDRTVAEV